MPVHVPLKWWLLEDNKEQEWELVKPDGWAEFKILQEAMAYSLYIYSEKPLQLP